MPKVSVIIINYNGKGLTVKCLQALRIQNYTDFEIILVDNASADSSLEEIAEFLHKAAFVHKVNMVRLQENMGFAGGNAKGLEYCTGEYIALLNNDTVVDENWLAELVKAMDTYPEVGICASKMLVYGTDVIDSAGDGFSIFLLKGIKRGEGESSERFKQQEYVFGACAGAALYRKSMLDEIGFLDEDFFLLHEDTDINFRAQLAGWKVLYVPTAVVRHKVRSTIGHMSDTLVYYTLRNSEFVRIKNIPFCIFLRCIPTFIIGMITEFIYFAITHGKLRLYLKAKMDAIKMLPKMLEKRTRIMKNKKVSNKYIISIMTPMWQKDFLGAKIKKLLYE